MNEDKIITMLLDHKDRLDDIENNMSTKQDIDGLHNTLDKLVSLAEKKDQELTFVGERIKRVEEDVARIKPAVGLA